ncbi:maleylacetoacetate isomerase [Pandoraea pulmonicola]|uniref:Maleylacetoacetate isomerase n=1 Tax=Pandoraea pulmonicola TaxID=93221 RepID=A0AAJ4Z878_PANPU|nr:maleylacetoacetate isomerase [Pandoraea pulmonicola]AJC23515.2 maleylacetoacetate isomerase [Pandoraea pulmonicola]SUA88614.1 Stringent starvation protein A homolog [Pandoraea pulmonicola]
MTIQLYGFWRSNAAFRVRVALALKQLPFEEIEIDLLAGDQFETAYARVNAESVVPTLVHDGQRISQSLAIMEYLDERFPIHRLLPDAPLERAYARSLALISIADSHPFVVPRVRKHLAQTYGADAAAIEAWCRHWGREGLAAYERRLVERPPSPFAMGDSPTLADICIAGQMIIADLYQLDVTAFPRVGALAQRCFDLPAFANAHPFRQPGYRPSSH